MTIGNEKVVQILLEAGVKYLFIVARQGTSILLDHIHPFGEQFQPILAAGASGKYSFGNGLCPARCRKKQKTYSYWCVNWQRRAIFQMFGLKELM
jgi:hypothetical protein